MRCATVAKWVSLGLLLLFGTLPVSAVPVSAASGSLPDLTLTETQIAGSQATIAVNVNIPDPQNASGVLLAGYSTVAGATPTHLALTWTQEASSWFPVWQLTLHSANGFLPPELVSKATVSERMGVPCVVLAQVAPTAGQQYRATTSYDAKRGALAVSITETTSGQLLFSGGWQLPAYTGSLYVASGVFADNGISASPPSTVSSVNITPGYLPLGTQWTIVQRSNEGGDFPASNFERRESSAFIQLVTPGISLPGEYSFSWQTSEQSQEFARISASANQTMVPIPVASLPLGRSILVMQYVENGQPRFANQKEVKVGRVNAWFDRPHVDTDDHVMHAALELQSRDAIENMHVNVRGTLYQIEWNAKERTFVETPYLEDALLHAGPVNLPDGTPVQLPVSITLPAAPHMWRLVLSADVTPDLQFSVANSEFYLTSYQPAQITAGQPFSFVVIPDTQFATRDYPQVYMRMMQWVAENAQTNRTALVLGVGDITESNAVKEWEQARRGYDLLRGVTPYVIAVGDHDMVQGSVKRGVSLVNQYFQATEFPSLAGLYQPGDLANAYYQFEIAGQKYMVITMEFAPPDEVLDWANQIVGQHPDEKVIVLTHAYLNGLAQPIAAGVLKNLYSMAKDTTTTMNEGVDIWAKFVQRHANIVMAIAGHTGSNELPYYVAVGQHGNKILQIMVNWQGEAYGGNGWLAMLTFTPDQKMEARVYSPFLGQFKQEPGKYGFTNHFIVDLKDLWVRDLPN